MVWLHALVRPIVGWSSEAIRAVDLSVVGSSILLLALWLKRLGISLPARTWFVAGCFFFYMFETEFIHCQRDGWMLLPTVIATHGRGRQIARASACPKWRLFLFGFLEGVFWASAVWIKPHCLVPALLVWLSSARHLAGLGRRVFFADFFGLLAGGLLIGGAGSAWLIVTGTWPYMWDVLLNWNAEYYKWTPDEMNHRLSMVIMYFAPWSLIHLAALPMAFLALYRARIWIWGATNGVSSQQLDRALLSALYLGWLFEAVILQKSFDYSQAPVHFIAFALVTSYRWPVAPIFISWCLLGGTINQYVLPELGDSWLSHFKKVKPFTYQQIVPQHVLVYRRWAHLWSRCLHEGSSPDIKDRLSFYQGIHCVPSWVELDEVRKFLETLDLQDGDLVCWDDATHPLYLDLKIKPAIRFMHVNTSLDFRSKRPVIRQELIDSGHKYVVNDSAVAEFIYQTDLSESPEDRPLDLPVHFPECCREIYPWNQPAIFKCGRFWVHRVEKPIGYIRLPHPKFLDMP